MKYPCLSNHLQEISEKKPEISDYADESRFHRFVMITQIISKITNQSSCSIVDFHCDLALGVGNLEHDVRQL